VFGQTGYGRASFLSYPHTASPNLAVWSRPCQGRRPGLESVAGVYAGLGYVPLCSPAVLRYFQTACHRVLGSADWPVSGYLTTASAPTWAPHFDVQYSFGTISFVPSDFAPTDMYSVLHDLFRWGRRASLVRFVVCASSSFELLVK
jgi:hypothetical protein